MSAPDFYFAVNAMLRHLHDRYGAEAMADYLRSLGREYYRDRIEAWKAGGPTAIASDWRAYFAREPLSVVDVLLESDAVELAVRVCPAIKHLRDSGRDIVPYYCLQCDYACGAMAEAAGYEFSRTGGMGSCRQRFTAVAENVLSEDTARD